MYYYFKDFKEENYDINENILSSITVMPKNYLNSLIPPILDFYYHNTELGKRQLVQDIKEEEIGILYLTKDFPEYNIGVRGIHITDRFKEDKYTSYFGNIYVDMKFIKNRYIMSNNALRIICVTDEENNKFANYYPTIYTRFENTQELKLDLKNKNLRLVNKYDMPSTIRNNFVNRDFALDLWKLHNIHEHNGDINIEDIINSNEIDFYYGSHDEYQKLYILLSELIYAIKLHINHQNYDFNLNINISHINNTIQNKQKYSYHFLKYMFNKIYKTLITNLDYESLKKMSNNATIIINTDIGNINLYEEEALKLLYQTNINQLFSDFKMRSIRFNI